MTYRGGLHRRPSVSAEVPITPSKYVPAPKFPKSEQQIADIRDAIQENFLFQGLSLKQTFDVIDVRAARGARAGSWAAHLVRPHACAPRGGPTPRVRSACLSARWRRASR